MLGRDAPRRDRGREDRGLADVGRHEGLGGTGEADRGDVVAERLVGLVERGARRRVRLGQRQAHADLLGALAGEHQGDHAASNGS